MLHTMPKCVLNNMLCKCHWIMLYTVHVTAFCLGAVFFRVTRVVRRIILNIMLKVICIACAILFVTCVLLNKINERMTNVRTVIHNYSTDT